jgi:hypothetical protein
MLFVNRLSQFTTAGKLTDLRSSHARLRSSILAPLLIMLAFGAVLAPTTWATPAQFGSEGEGAGQLEEGRGAAVEQSSGDVYIADRNNNRVEEWSKEGEFLRAWGWGVQNGEEKLQTCTTGTGCRPGSGGGGAGQFTSPLGTAVDSDPLSASVGDVYVVDAGNNRVEKFGPDGEFLLMFGGEGSADGEFEGLSNRQLASIAVNAEGDVYVGDANRVQRFSEDGVYEATVLEGAGEIEALAAALGGDVYALSSDRAGVREYDASGNEVVPVVPARDEGGEPRAIAAGPGGSLFVDDDLDGTHSIRVYNAAGEETQAFDEGEEDGAYGIGWSEAAGALYVVGIEGGRRVRIVPQPPPGPVVRPRSELASEIEPTTAGLHATVNPEDREGEGEYDFEYGTVPCATVSCGSVTPVGKLAASFESGEVETPLSGLKPETIYHFRVVATDSKGHRTVGPEATFTTAPAVKIEETSVSDIAATSATFSAELHPLGVAAGWRIEYDSEAAKLGTEEATIAGKGTLAAGSAGVTVSAHVQTGLSAATAYYYRVVAEDEREGAMYVVEGPDQTFTTQGEGETLALPDGRAWELVSPPARHGAPIKPIEEDAPVQAAADGGAIAYATVGAIEAAAEGNRAIERSTVLSTHGPEGWSSRDIATANENVTEGYLAGRGDGYLLFSPDLSTALVEPRGTTPLPPLTPAAEQTLYLRHADGSFEALVTAANVEAGTHFGGSLEFVGATPDLAHVVFSSTVSLINGKGPGFYEWSAGRLQFLASGGTLGSAPISHSAFNRRGAVASEGTRVFFTAAGEHLYMFDTETEKTVQLDTVHEGEGATGFGRPEAFYQDTSVETGAQGTQVTRAFFTDSQELTRGASEGSLYEYDTQTGALSDLTVPVNAGESAAVQGLLPGVSEDGSYVYAVAQGVLTTGANAYGETATAGADNLYELHRQGESWQPTFIATMSVGDGPDWGGPNARLEDLTARVSPDGRFLAFMSQRSLTGYDNIDVNEATGRHADEEVYLYDAQSAKLVCASCDPSGARPTGIDDIEEERPLIDETKVWASGTWLAASVPGWTLMKTGEALYQSRYLDDAGRLFFDSADVLVPQTINHTEDVYEYEPPVGAGGGGAESSPELSEGCTTASSTYSPAARGCIELISSGTSSQESAFLDASESGDDVFFLSAARLTPQAPASGYDVYDAHLCGAGWACAAPHPVGVAPCESASECRAPSLSGAGAGSTPASASFEGTGNLAGGAGTNLPAVVKSLTRAQKLVDALRTCRKDKKQSKRKKCEKEARTKYGVAKAKKSTKGRK